MHSVKDKYVERERRSKQFIELFTLLSATPSQDRHGKQKVPFMYLEYATKGSEPTNPEWIYEVFR